MAADQAAYFFPFRYSDGDIPSVFLNERIKKLAELYPTASAASLMVICVSSNNRFDSQACQIMNEIMTGLLFKNRRKIPR